MIAQGGNKFSFSLIKELPHSHTGIINIPSSYVSMVYNEALDEQKQLVQPVGFAKGNIPLYYIEQNFKANILDHLKEFFFTHCVINFLCESLYEQKIVLAGEPTLADIYLDISGDAKFMFGLNIVNTENDKRWKKISYKAPSRKNYKDIDKQVESFIKDETQQEKNYKSEAINIGDWVCFEMSVLNKKNEPLIDGYKDILWVKMSEEEADLELHKLFLGKKIKDEFNTDNPYLQSYVSNKLIMHYNFLIKIINYIPFAYFSFDSFKSHFQLKNPKDIHTKLIEIFSFRNDMSQRRETIESTLKSVLKQYYINIPSGLIEKQKKIVLDAIHDNPDYIVYKAQNDFKEKISLLAEKQLKESILIDTIAYQENIKVNDADVIGYLNLIKKPRTKAFIYFDMPATKINGQETPISNELIKRYCLREKTLNYVINHLTKNNK